MPPPNEEDEMRAPSVAMLRRIMRRCAPAKLVGSGKRKGFRRVYSTSGRVGAMMRGLTRMLEERAFSVASLPSVAKRASTKRSEKEFRGRDGGRKRGRLVDKQLSVVANGGKLKRPHRLTRIALATLASRDVTMVRGQQPVVHDRSNVASAVDVVGMRGDQELVLIELKTGYDSGRLAPAMRNGTPQYMQPPLNKASDCVVHRHLAQLSATAGMFIGDQAMMNKLKESGIRRVTGELLYVTDDDVEVIELNEWWMSRGSRLLNTFV